jgi:hypothetical protein
VKLVALVPLWVALVAALVPSGALAKGGEEEAGLSAEITGPGLDKPISLAGNSLQDAELVTRIAETAGFFPAVYGVFSRAPGVSLDPMLRARPKGDLGPRYTITYLVPGPKGQVARLLQDLYPYAKLRPAPTIAPGQTVTYTASGQLVGGEKTRGGWYVATSYLKDNLIAAGVPESPSAGGGDSEPTSALIGALTGLGVVLAAAAFLMRRHGQRRTVAT